MNVLILINSFSHGGAETMCYRIAEYLTKKSANVFICSTGKYKTEVETSITKELNNKGIVTYVRDETKSKMHFIFYLKKICKTNKIDIIHTNCKSPNYYGRIAVFFNRRIKIVTTIHNDSSGKYFDELFFKRRTNYYVAVSKRVFDVCSNKLKINIKKIKIINNGINFFNSIDKSDGRYFTILSVGRVYNVKNYLAMSKCINALMNLYSNIRWVVVGSYNYDKNYFEEIKCALSNNIDRVIFSGEHDDVSDYYNQANCFLSLSKNEGFGLAIVEAVFSGIPTLTSNVGIVEELIDLGANIQIVSEENAIVSIENEYQKWLKLGKTLNSSNTEIVKKYFSNELMCEKYFELFKELIKA